MHLAGSRTSEGLEVSSRYSSFEPRKRRPRTPSSPASRLSELRENDPPTGKPPDAAEVYRQLGQITRQLHDTLRELGYDYGDFPAHAGLWEMAEKTTDDALVRKMRRRCSGGIVWFSLQPPGTKVREFIDDYCRRMGGRRVQPGFSYDSGSNEEFLSVPQLRALIDRHVETPHVAHH